MRAMVAAVACLSIIGLSHAADVRASIKEAISIPAQEVGSALQTLSKERDIHVIFLSEDVNKRRTQGAKGKLSVDEALKQLLSGTGLTYQYIDEETVSILPAAAAPAAPATTSSARRVGSQTVGVVQKGPHNTATSVAGTAKQTRKNFWDRFHLAEGSEDSAAKQSNQMTAIAEVVVTARRREEDVQKVPSVVNVFSQAQLDERNIQSINALKAVAPSLSLDGGPEQGFLYVRGIGGPNNNGPAVVVYMDEVPLPSGMNNGATIAGPGQFYDLQNVQVLAGPQGTLFGRNAASGAVLLQTRRPESDLGGYVQLTMGNYNDRELVGALNVPIITDKLLARLAVSTQKRDGFTKVLSTPTHPNGLDLDDSDFVSARLSITAKPIESVQNDLILSYHHADTNGSALVLAGANPAFGIPGLAAGLAQQQQLGIRRVQGSNVDPKFERIFYTIADTLTVNLTDDTKLRNIASYMREKFDASTDEDGVDTGFGFDSTQLKSDINPQFTEELQLTGISFGDRLNWTVGAFYLKTPQNEYSDSLLHFFGGFSLTTGRRREESSKALYTQATWKVVDSLRFTAGVRHTWDRRFTQGTTNSVPGLPGGPANFGATTWNLSLDYDIAERVLGYVSVRRGYRAGGFNPLPPTPSDYQFDPEYVTDYELGLKSQQLLGSMPVRLNVALFHDDYTNIQTTVFVTDPNTGFLTGVTRNAASASSWGGELDANILLTPNLEVGGNYEYLDIKFKTLPGQPRLFPRAQPKDKYSIYTKYTFATPDSLGKVDFLLNWTWQGPSNIGNPAVPFNSIAGYGVLSAAADWDKIGGSKFGISFFMDNITDENYVVQAFNVYDGLGFASYTYGPPRTFGVRGRYSF